MSLIKPGFGLTFLTSIQTEEIYTNGKNGSHFFNKKQKYLMYVSIYFYTYSNINVNGYVNIF